MGGSERGRKGGREKNGRNMGREGGREEGVSWRRVAWEISELGMYSIPIEIKVVGLYTPGTEYYIYNFP